MQREEVPRRATCAQILKLEPEQQEGNHLRAYNEARHRSNVCLEATAQAQEDARARRQQRPPAQRPPRPAELAPSSSNQVPVCNRFDHLGKVAADEDTEEEGSGPRERSEAVQAPLIELGPSRSRRSPPPKGQEDTSLVAAWTPPLLSDPREEASLVKRGPLVWALYQMNLLLKCAETVELCDRLPEERRRMKQALKQARQRLTSHWMHNDSRSEQLQAFQAFYGEYVEHVQNLTKCGPKDVVQYLTAHLHTLQDNLLRSLNDGEAGFRPDAYDDERFLALDAALRLGFVTGSFVQDLTDEEASWDPNGIVHGTNVALAVSQDEEGNLTAHFVFLERDVYECIQVPLVGLLCPALRDILLCLFLRDGRLAVPGGTRAHREQARCIASVPRSGCGLGSSGAQWDCLRESQKKGKEDWDRVVRPFVAKDSWGCYDLRGRSEQGSPFAPPQTAAPNQTGFPTAMGRSLGLWSREGGGYSALGNSAG